MYVCMQAWDGWSEEWNTWEPASNIEASLIADYKERQHEAEEEEMQEAQAGLPVVLRLCGPGCPTTAEPMETDTQLEDEGEVAGEVGVEVAQHEAVELSIQKIIAHFVFPGAKPGSLEKVGVRVL